MYKCLECKSSKNLCGLGFCPLLSAINKKTKIENMETFFGPSSSIFIGTYGYPNVFAGPVGVLQNNLTQTLFGLGYKEIIDIRTSTIRSKTKRNIFSSDKLILDMQALVLSSRPTDIEVEFKKPPQYKISFSPILQPMGPVADMKKFKIASNPKIKKKTEKIINDECHASEQAILLYKFGNDVYKIYEIFSSGSMGIKRKLVPTRWSITAIDDILCKAFLEDIRQFKLIDKFAVYSAEYMSNHFEILLIPGKWEYENFELWFKGSFWSPFTSSILYEYEPYEGRKSYADKETGGYYAARFGVAEALWKMRRQARVIVFREVYEGYSVPLGVWVVRETVRSAFKKKPKSFSFIGEALSYISSNLRCPLKEYKKKSRILQQKTLNQF